MSKLLFATACVPVFLPVDDLNNISLDVIPQYFKFLYENGIRSLFINGGCGEFSSLTVSERKIVLKKWFEVISDDVQIVVNIGTTNLGDTIELGNDALSYNKLYAIAIVPPFYMSINNEENLLDYLLTVTNALNRKIPILYYHIPCYSKVVVNIRDFLKLVKERQFTQLSAIKCTDSSFANFQYFFDGIKSNNLSINLYCGFDTLISEAINAGAAGAIMGSSNMKPKLINAIVQKTLPESEQYAISSIRDFLDFTIKFANSQKLNMNSLLKFATEFFTKLKLGPGKKPYVVPKHKLAEYQKILEELKFPLD